MPPSEDREAAKDAAMYSATAALGEFAEVLEAKGLFSPEIKAAGVELIASLEERGFDIEQAHFKCLNAFDYDTI